MIFKNTYTDRRRIKGLILRFEKFRLYFKKFFIYYLLLQIIIPLNVFVHEYGHHYYAEKNNIDTKITLHNKYLLNPLGWSGYTSIVNPKIYPIMGGHTDREITFGGIKFQIIFLFILIFLFQLIYVPFYEEDFNIKRYNQTIKFNRYFLFMIMITALFITLQIIYFETSSDIYQLLH